MRSYKKKGKTRKRNQRRVFTKKDYNSGDGMLTSVWGPSMWHSLHTISFNYPINPTKEDKNNYREFILQLRNVLPCKYCRINLEKNFKSLPLTMDVMKNRESFSRYIYNLHELINRMLHKKSTLTYCDVRERYEHFRARCTLDEMKEKIFSEKNIKNYTSKTLKNKKENGCTEPLYGRKAKCVLKIVPLKNKTKSFTIDDKCVKKRSMTKRSKKKHK